MNDLIFILLTLLFFAFFSGMEIAFLTSNKLKIELERGKGILSARLLTHFVKYPAKLIAALLLGGNIMLVINGMLMSELLDPMLEPGFPDSEYLVLIFQTLITTLIILFFGEFLPKVLFRLNPNRILNVLTIPLVLFYYLLYPLIYVFIWSAEWILKKLFKIELSESEYIFTIVDLDEYIRHFVPEESSDQEVQQEIQMFHNAMEFRNVKLRECMVPRTEVVAVEESEPIGELMSRFIDSEFSRILVFRESIDNIVGYVHSFEMFRAPKSIKDIIKPVFYVPETMLASHVMNMFIENHRSIAVVVDEFGGTSGIVTIEDVMEEIFGEIEDEFDSGDMAEQMIDDKTFLFSARLEIDYLNDKYDFHLPVSTEYETLAGFIIHHHESIPLMNEKIFIEPYSFDIVKVSGNRIEQVKMTVVK